MTDHNHSIWDPTWVERFAATLGLGEVPADWPNRMIRVNTWLGHYGPAGFIIALEGSPVRFTIITYRLYMEPRRALIWLPGTCRVLWAAEGEDGVTGRRWAIIDDFLTRHGLRVLPPIGTHLVIQGTGDGKYAMTGRRGSEEGGDGLA